MPKGIPKNRTYLAREILEHPECFCGEIGFSEELLKSHESWFTLYPLVKFEYMKDGEKITLIDRRGIFDENNKRYKKADFERFMRKQQ